MSFWLQFFEDLAVYGARCQVNHINIENS